MSINLLSNSKISKSLGLLNKDSLIDGVIVFPPNAAGPPAVTTWTSVASGTAAYGWKAVFPFPTLNNNLTANSIAIATVSANILSANIVQYSTYWIISSRVLPIGTVGALNGGVEVVVSGTDATTPPPDDYEVDFIVIY